MKKSNKTVHNSAVPLPGLFIFSGPYIYIILLIIGITIYSNTFHNQFVFDDNPNIVTSTLIKDIKDFNTIWIRYPTRSIGLYTFALNYHFHGLDVTGYHVVNLVIHILTSFIVYWLVILTLSTPAMQKDRISEHKKIIAGFAALLFITHPLQTQAVTYIVQRLASFATLFYLTALSLYVKARLIKGRIFFRVLLFLMAGLSALLGMLTKETLFTLPFAVAIFEFFFLREPRLSQARLKKIVKLLWAIPFVFFVLIIPYLFYFRLIVIFQNKVSQRYGDPLITPFRYFVTQFRVFVTYIRLLFLPVKQRLDYDFPISNSFFEPKVILSFIFLAALLYMAFRLFKRQRIISWGIIWFFLTLSVESSIIPLPNVLFEHRLYLPMVGFSLIVASSLFYLLREKHSKTMIIILVSLICIYSIMTYERNKVWKNDYTLWSDGVKKAPNKDRTHYNLGLALYDLGMNDQAINEFYRTLRLNPTHIKACISLGNTFSKQGKHKEAIKEFDRALQMNPQYAEVYYNRGNAFLSRRNYEAAIADFKKALSLNPQYAEACTNLGNALFDLGRIEDAVSEYNNALNIDKDNILAHYNLGYALYTQGNVEEAVREFKTVLRQDQSNVKTLVNLGSALVSLGNFDEAAENFRKALALDSAHENAHYKLGIILDHQGKTEDAIRHLREAIRLKPDFADAHRSLAAIYEAQGKTKESRAHYEKAESLKK